MSEVRHQLVAGSLNFPTSLAFDDGGVPWVAEAGLPFGGAPVGGRVLELGQGGTRVVEEGLAPPVNGLVHHDGGFYVSVGGQPSRILRLQPDGTSDVVLDGLPGPGNYQTNMGAVGPDGKLYFSQGAMTNSGVVGLDSYEIGWLARLPHAHDVPGFDVVLSGFNARTPDPLSGDGSEATTGAFMPFGTASTPGQRLPAGLPCTAALMRCGLDGSGLELVAWGLRNAYGIGFLPDGRLLAVDQGADDRGSRPIGNAPDLLYQVEPGSWCGWPDFIGGVPVTDERFRPQRGALPGFVLANHAELPPPQAPVLAFPAHSAATKFDVGGSALGPWEGHLFVALFGDEVPMTAPSGPRVGRSVVRVDPNGWTLHPLDTGSFLRPIDVSCWPGQHALGVLDFGMFEITEAGVVAQPGTGSLWKVSLE